VPGDDVIVALAFGVSPPRTVPPTRLPLSDGTGASDGGSSCSDPPAAV
jgi:hypothetical protein